MQKIDVFLRASSARAVAVDEYNNAVGTLISITRGMQAEFVLHLFHGEDFESAYTAADLDSIASWIWYADDDYDTTTPPILIVPAGAITVDGDGLIHIPVTETNTAEIIEFLGTRETKNLKCELAGFTAGNTAPSFILQWEFSIRNRIGAEGTGQPEPVGDANYTAAQIDALFAAANLVEYSIDGETWHAECPVGAMWRRYKNSAIAGAQWTVESLSPGAPGIDGADGVDGADGSNAYLYVAYAADAAGSGFSLVPDESLKFRAEFSSAVLIAAPSLADFTAAAAVWVKYLGDDGDGDMSMADFVNDGGTGIVLAAKVAETANSVDYANVQNAPEAARQIVGYAAGGRLPVEYHVVYAAGVCNTGLLELIFDVFRGGKTYSGSDGDIYTWEYHVTASAHIAVITPGENVTLLFVWDDEVGLPLVDGKTTLHVFTVRARYSSTAQRFVYAVNYAYGEVL